MFRMGEKMRRFLFTIGLFIISYCCFSQQNIPSRIIGRIPGINSTQTYQIQVGAFRIAKNADNVSVRLRAAGFNPIHESYLNLTRVLIPNIQAGQVRDHLVRIKSLGFNEVIIREDGNNIVREKLTENIQLTLDENTSMNTLLKASDKEITELVMREIEEKMNIPSKDVSVEYILRDNDSQAMAVKVKIKQ